MLYSFHFFYSVSVRHKKNALGKKLFRFIFFSHKKYFIYVAGKFFIFIIFY